ncbi:MAG: hypothetical protein WCP87_07425, partial [Atribacterota bacterium]
MEHTMEGGHLMDLSPRERIIRVLTRHGELDRIPWSLHFGASSAFTPGSYQKFRQKTGTVNDVEAYDFPVRVAHSENEEPHFHTSSSNFGLRMTSNGISAYFFDPPLPLGASLTPWGVGLISWPENPGSEQMVHPLANSRSLREIEEYPVPGVDQG